MKEGPLSHKYIKVGDKIDLMVKGDISLYQMTETGAMVQTAIQDRIIEVIDLEEIFKEIAGRVVEKGYRNERCGNNNNRDGNRSRERTFAGNYRRDRSSSNDRSRSGSRASTNRDRIMCYACREYDHFAGNCPNSRGERDLEQLQHMLNMEEQDHRSLTAHSSDEDCRSPLNL